MNGVRRGLFALLTLAGCADGIALSVDVKTDFVPGAEFAALRVRLVGEDSSNTVGAAGDYLSGQRVLDLDGLQENSARVVSVELLDRLGAVVAERTALVDHRVDRGITLTLARDCAGVSCPGAGAAAATACFGGRCAEPECIDGTEPSCPDPECLADTDCPVLNACSTRRCIDTLCLYAPGVGACAVGTYCSPEQGCLALPSPVDASMDAMAMPRDAGTDASVTPDTSVAALPAPRLRWPQNGTATGSAATITLRWAPVALADSYLIEVRGGCDVDMNVPCTSSPIVDVPLGTSALSIVATALGIDAMPVGRRYRWRVRACRDDGPCGEWSTERYFDARRRPADFDGNGEDELLIGSTGHVSVFGYQGGAFVAIQELPTPFSDGTSGFARTSFVGDLNGDGFMDAAIGAPFDRGFGSVAIYHGGPGGLVFNQRLESPPSSPLNNFFSDSLCLADFDADGYADLAVRGSSGTFVYSGSAAGIIPVLVAELPERILGCADVDEDGRADIVVGGGYYRGHASTLIETTSATLPSSAQFYVGDVNGDGFADFTGRSTPAGILYGNAGGLDAAVAIGGAAGGTFSFDYQALGLADINSDGFSDIVMGDVQSDSRSPGIVALSLGGLSGVTPRVLLNIPCMNACNRRGYAVTYGFDLNGDGFGDAAVSANEEEGVFVFFGRSTGLDPISVRISPSESFDDFGSSL